VAGSELKLGVFVPQGWRMDLADVPDPVEKYETMSRCAREAETAGFDAIFLYDHFHTVPTPQRESVFECWTSMAALARDTRSIRLGQMVTCNSYRPPSLLAKMASGIDVMSRGRVILGIGAGWYQHEYEAYGYEYPDTPDRLRMLRESLQVIKALWTQDEAHFDGRYYKLRGAINEPKPVQKPHPPIWIGGSGPKRTLRVVAKHADVWNSNARSIDETRELNRILADHCAKVGRDPNTIRRSHQLRIDDIDAALAQIAASRREGFSEFLIFPAQGGDLRKAAEAAAKLLPRLRAAG